MIFSLPKQKSCFTLVNFLHIQNNFVLQDNFFFLGTQDNGFILYTHIRDSEESYDDYFIELTWYGGLTTKIIRWAMMKKDNIKKHTDKEEDIKMKIGLRKWTKEASQQPEDSDLCKPDLHKPMCWFHIYQLIRVF